MSNIGFWLKRNTPSLIFGGTFTLLAGYFGYNMYQQNRFLTPVVSQTVNILSRNQRIKQLLGFPLAYKSTSSRSISQRKSDTYYTFTVAGPRGTTEVEVTCQKKLSKHVYDYKQIQNNSEGEQVLNCKQNISNKQQQLNKINEQINTLKNQISQTKSFFKSKQSEISKEQLKNKQLEKNKVEQQLKGLNDTIQAYIQRKIKDKNDYYIPSDGDVYNQIMSSAATGKDLNKVISGDLPLFRINQLSVQLPNKSRISIISEGKNLSQVGKPKIDMATVITPSYQALNQKLKMDLAELTKEQLQFYSKNKTDSMYKKYSMHRILITVLLGSCCLFGYKAYKSRKLLNVSNSVLTQIVSVRFSKNPKILQLWRLKKVKNFKIDQMVTGGMVKNKFDCSVSVHGFSMGKIQFSGIFDEKISHYEFSKLQFSYLQGNQTKKIDLLK